MMSSSSIIMIIYKNLLEQESHVKDSLESYLQP